MSWAVVLAWHVRREYFRPMAIRLAEASADLNPMASFYSVRLGDATIGYAASRIDTLSDGFVLEDDVRLRVVAMGSDVPAIVRTRVRLGNSLELREFQFTLRSDFGSFSVAGSMSGDSVLDLNIVAGDDEQSVSMPTDGPIVLPQVMPVLFVLGSEPEVGEVYAFDVFDPSVMEIQRVTLEVVGEETLIIPDSAVFDGDRAQWVPARFDTVETWHVRQAFGGVELESWFDPDGMVVRATSPLGYTIERTAFEIAWNEYRALGSAGRSAALDATDVIERTAISVGVDLPEGDRLTGLTVRLRDVDLTGFDLDGARQRLEGDVLHVDAGPATAEPSYTLPADPEGWSEQLAATPLIQVNDDEIRKTAATIVGEEANPRIAAEQLAGWVYKNLAKKITFSVPSARQVLDAREGDCNEHTVLYVALARAVGLPARTAAGLVYVNDRFFYHAWPEVWLDGWVPVDPTLGQFPADASHLRFVVGGLARQVELVRLIGQLQLDVISVEER